MTIYKHIKIIGLISLICLVTLIMGSEGVSSQKDFTLLHFACSGELGVSSGEKMEIISDKYHLGDVQRGMLFKEYFLTIDTNSLGEAKLECTNLKSRQTTYLSDLDSVVEKNYTPWGIGYVDNKLIILSAYEYDINVTIDKQKRHALLYQFDRYTKTTQKMPISDCSLTEFSYYRGRIYYTSTDGTIHECIGYKNQSLDIKGMCPIISPDGTKIAYISYGIFGDGVYIYDFQSKEKTSVIGFFGPGSIWPTIRWSSDSKLVAIQRKSDLFSQPLYVVNISTKKVVCELKNAYACNWFFVDGKGGWRGLGDTGEGTGISK
jgi:hypothetical protein